jgi:hypothetical protein
MLDFQFLFLFFIVLDFYLCAQPYLALALAHLTGPNEGVAGRAISKISSQRAKLLPECPNIKGAAFIFVSDFQGKDRGEPHRTEPNRTKMKCLFRSKKTTIRPETIGDLVKQSKKENTLCR